MFTKLLIASIFFFSILGYCNNSTKRLGMNVVMINGENNISNIGVNSEINTKNIKLYNHYIKSKTNDNTYEDLLLKLDGELSFTNNDFGLWGNYTYYQNDYKSLKDISTGSIGLSYLVSDDFKYGLGYSYSIADIDNKKEILRLAHHILRFEKSINFIKTSMSVDFKHNSDIYLMSIIMNSSLYFKPEFYIGLRQVVDTGNIYSNNKEMTEHKLMLELGIEF